MTDAETPAAVTDSRFAGFNPEVEASHAETAAGVAAAAAATAASAAASAPPPPQRSAAQVAGDLLVEIVAHLGNPPRLTALLTELSEK